jgi:hypothetical protein
MSPRTDNAPLRQAEDIAPAFAAIAGRTDALYVCGDLLQSMYRIRINTLALKIATTDDGTVFGTTPKRQV